jgi:pyruvate dehydrogenase E2 component (dihydrolipoamide acetyltransferase)
MATEIVMPRLGWTMEEGVLAEWLKHDGDTVNVGEIIFTVESDKALNEVEAFESGILRIPPDSPPPGTTVKVGGLLAYLVQPGEPAPFETTGAAGIKYESKAVQAAPSVRISSAIAQVSSETNRRTFPAISPRARRVAQELGVDWTTLQGSGSTGRIIERDVRAAEQRPDVTPAAETSGAVPLEISPVARRAAQELGVDLAELAAQFPGKRISREDVERAAATRSAGALPPTLGVKRAAIPRIRRVIAERMSASAGTTAPVTLTTEVDATELVKLRQQLKGDASAAARSVPSYNDLLAKVCAVALAEHPMLNARLEDDETVLSDAVHIGLAVDTERGLLVPVIRDVQSKNLRQLASESVALAEAARAGTLIAAAMSGGTFTISNLGMYDIDAFTPIINLPECAILGVGRIVPKQVVTDVEAEQVAIRHMLFLSLTFDHRLVDGAPAARFLQRIKQFVEQPYLWLVG